MVKLFSLPGGGLLPLEDSCRSPPAAYPVCCRSPPAARRLSHLLPLYRRPSASIRWPPASLIHKRPRGGSAAEPPPGGVPARGCVHLAVECLLPSGRLDSLFILQLQPNPDTPDVKRAFRRLANLLAPRRDPHPRLTPPFAPLKRPSPTSWRAPPPAPVSLLLLPAAFPSQRCALDGLPPLLPCA
ncbi:hypothetical protein ACQJBY_014074 [Aegilops geniculata]